MDLSLSDAWEQVCASLKLAAEQQSIELDKGINVGLFQVFNSKVEDEWQGLPGHDISIEFPRFESLEHPNLASELTYFFQGRALSVLINSRQKPWNQYPELFEDKADFSSTNGRWDNFGIVHSNNSILSLTYEVGWYGAGAAHPNHHFETFNFWFKDRLFFLELEDFFIDITSALIKISDLCISALAKEYWIRTNEKPDNDQMEWFNKGAAPDLINFEAFNVGADHFTFLFAPYQVAAYAFGRWSVDISFYDLLDFLKPDGLHKLAMKSIEDN